MNVVSMDTAKRVLRRARKAAQIGLLTNNFVEVWGSIVGRRKLHELRLRNGLRIGAPDTVQLWNHFNDIWLDHVYTSGDFEIPANGTVVDIGANIGLFSMLSAQRAAKVLSFEPFGPCFEWLSKNVQVNGLSNIVRPLNVAVAGTRGTRTFHVQPEYTSNSFYSGDGGQAVTVDCTTLDAIVGEDCAGRCDFLKMDCEGAEYEILLGCQDQTLRQIAAISMEVHEGIGGHDRSDLQRRLGSTGFDVELADFNGCLILKAKNRELTATRAA